MKIIAMEIKEITEKQKAAFNKVALHPLQSWEWGEFREQSGNKVVRLGIFINGKLTEAIQVIFSLIPYTNFKIGTVLKGPTPTKEILGALKKLGKEENAIFIKLEPNVTLRPSGGVAPETILRHLRGGRSSPRDHDSSKVDQNRYVKLVQSFGCVPGKRFFTPTTFWIDLTKSEEELLKSFSSKTRYNIKIAQKHGVRVEIENGDREFERYLELTRETVQRQGFFAHSEQYHRLMWKYLHENFSISNLRSLSNKTTKTPIAHLLVAKYKNEIVSTWILFSWHDFLYYPYGASTEAHKEVMANNLMMWEAIKFGKKLGLTTFDLWGREEGKGFTRFKEGYNPQVVEFLGSWDLITSPLYWSYRLAETIRWFLLRIPNRLGFIKPRF